MSSQFAADEYGSSWTDSHPCVWKKVIALGESDLSAPQWLDQVFAREDVQMMTPVRVEAWSTSSMSNVKRVMRDVRWGRLATGNVGV